MLSVHVDPKLKFREIDKLIDMPVVVLVNKFDEDSAKHFRADFNRALNTGQKIVPIVIDSYGGVCYSLMSMIGVIKASPVPVATIGTGKMMSCGANLLCHGTEGYRFMDPFSTFMWHDVSLGAWGKIEEVKADAKEGERLNILLAKLAAQNIGKPEDFFLKLVDEHKHADAYFVASQCKEMNIVNHIRMPKFNVKVLTDVSFE